MGQDLGHNLGHNLGPGLGPGLGHGSCSNYVSNLVRIDVPNYRPKSSSITQDTFRTMRACVINEDLNPRSSSFTHVPTCITDFTPLVETFALPPMSERHRRYRHQFVNYGRNAADESRRHRVTRSVFFKPNERILTIYQLSVATPQTKVAGIA